MYVLWILAKNTYKEIIRDRVLYGLLVFALILVGVSLVLGQLSFSEQARISANFGMTGTHLSAVLLAIFVGSTLVSKEIDKKTVLTLLARPLTRLQFIIGKALGLLLVISTVVIGLAFVMLLIFLFLGMEINHLFFIGLYGIFLESIILLGMSLFFSSFTRPISVVCYTIGIFLIGHWLESLKFFAVKSGSQTFGVFYKAVAFVFPDLEKFNWRSLFVYKSDISFYELSTATVYSLAWFGFLLMITAMVIRKKDFA